jgi:hypothetical protein
MTIVPFDIPAMILSPSLLIVIAVTLESGGICQIAFGIDKVAMDEREHENFPDSVGKQHSGTRIKAEL